MFPAAQLSDYDSSYPQQRVDVNSYNTKQEKAQQQIALYASDAASTDYNNADYNYSYEYASAGAHDVLFCIFEKQTYLSFAGV